VAFTLAEYSRNFQRKELLVLALLGSILGIWTLLRFLRYIDEFERQYTHEALRFAFVGMLCLSVLEAFLENFGFPRVPGYGNAAFAVILWSLGLAISSWQRHWRHE
jgi:tellurite resistance protein TehA-like permease